MLLRFQTGAAGGAAGMDRGLEALGATLLALAELQGCSPGGASAAGRDEADPTVGFQFDTEMFLATSDAMSAQMNSVRSYRAEPTIVARYVPFGRVGAPAVCHAIGSGAVCVRIPASRSRRVGGRHQ